MILNLMILNLITNLILILTLPRTKNAIIYLTLTLLSEISSPEQLSPEQMSDHPVITSYSPAISCVLFFIVSFFCHNENSNDNDRGNKMDCTLYDLNKYNGERIFVVRKK